MEFASHAGEVPVRLPINQHRRECQPFQQASAEVRSFAHLVQRVEAPQARGVRDFHRPDRSATQLVDEQVFLRPQDRGAVLS